jgi:hypothetical protein
MVEGVWDKDIARGLFEQHVKDRLQETWKVHAIRRLGPQPGRYKVVLRRNLEQNPFHEREDLVLEEEVVEHGEALELHSKRLEDIEKRIRQLEVKSVQELQEAPEEKSQSPQVVN